MGAHSWTRERQAGRPAFSISPLADSMTRRVEAELARLGVKPADRIMVALSGGPDSLALLAALSRRPRLCAAHLDHSTRPGTEEEAAAVARLCRAWKVPLLRGKLDPARVERSARALRSREAALREGRYRFLEAAARKAGARWVLTGHQAGDQAETVLYRARRDWRSLAGIPPRRGIFLRPLLGVPRREILAFLRRVGLVPLLDPSNADPAFTRNRIRRLVLPHLRRSLHPRISPLLLRLGEAAAALRSWEAAELSRRRVPADLRGGIRADRLALLPASLREGAAARALSRSLGRSPSRAQVTVLLRLARIRRDGEQAVAGGYLRRAGGRLLFRRSPLPPLGPGNPVPLTVPGRAVFPPSGGILTARLVPWREGDPHPAGNSAALDPALASRRLSVRARRPGDRIRPLGMRGRKKLQDLLVDRKVPLAARDGIPLVVDGGGSILWVAGHAVAEEARLPRGAGKALLLTWIPGRRGKP